MKNYVLYLGLVAGILTTGAGIPQVYQIYTTDNTDGISVIFALTYMIGLYIWTLYGHILNRPSLKWFSLISALFWSYISYKVIKHMII